MARTSNASKASIDERGIADYVRATRAIDRFAATIVDPFEDAAKRKGKELVYEGDGARIVLNETVSQQRASPKDAVTLLRLTLAGALDRNAAGKQMYGVRRFGDAVAMDADYLASELEAWTAAIIGSTRAQQLIVSGERLEEIALAHRPRLLRAPASVAKDPELYLAARHQIGQLKRAYVTPVEKALKKQARTDPAETVFDQRDYGRLSVLVKSVPRGEPNYKQTRDWARKHLASVAAQPEKADGKYSFLNEDRNDPGVYVAIPGLLKRIDVRMEEKEAKMRQELQVLYRPSQKLLIVR